MSVMKNSISILEELAASRVIERPVYNVTVVRQGFQCEIKCGNLTATAVACTKKLAKHECANQALMKLQCEVKVNDVDKPTNQEPLGNPVGKLNELCSRNGANYPNYVDRDGLNGNFVIECNCLDYSTTGSHVSKKQAKQLAAMEMLKKIQLSDFKNNSRSAPANCNYEEIVELYKDLKLSHKSDETKDETLISDETTKPQEEIICKDELYVQLDALVVEYTVETLQHRPLILILKATITGGQKYTFLESRGETYDECHDRLLHSAIKGIVILKK